MNNNGCLLLLIAVIFVYVPVRSLLQYFFKKHKKNYWLLLLQYLAFLLTLLLCIHQTKIPFNEIGFEIHVSGSHFILMILICCVTVIAIDSISLHLYKRQQKERLGRGIMNQAYSGIEAKNTPEIICFLFIAAVWEELAYRGMFFYWGNKVHLNLLVTIIIGAAYFGFIHISNGIRQCYYSFFFGLMFGILFVLTNSMTGIILAHFAGNLFAVFIARPTIAKLKQRSIFY